MACEPRRPRYFGIRSLRIASIGVATKIDEYEPVIRPTSSARENSRSATAPMMPEPMISRDSTGRTAARLVLSERINIWFIDTLMMSAYGTRLDE